MPRMTEGMKAEPNLTPLLDVVFQLITFFMLLINFSTDNYDKRIHLPVAGTARPVEEADKAAGDRLVLNIDRTGHLLMNGEAMATHKAIAEIKHQGELVRINLKAAGQAVKPGEPLPSTVIFRADKDATFSQLYPLIKACQTNGFFKFALKAKNGP